MIKSTVVAVLLLGCPGSVAAAPRVSGGLTPLFGSNEFRGLNAFLALGTEHLSIAPEFKSYEFSGSGGRINAATVRTGFDTRWFGAGVTGGYSMAPSQSRTLSGGADFAVTLSPLGDTGIRRIGGSSRGGAPVGKGIARIDFGGGFTATEYRQSTGGAQDRRLAQREFHGFVGASVLGILSSVRVAKFDYSSLTVAPFLPLGTYNPIVGHMNSSNGYADSSAHANVELPIFPMIRPFSSLTYTKYRALTTTSKPGDSRALSVGVRVGLELVAAEAAFQHVNTVGSQRENNYYTLGASLRL